MLKPVNAHLPAVVVLCYANQNLGNKKRFPSDGCHNITEKAKVCFVLNFYIFSRDTSKYKLHFC